MLLDLLLSVFSPHICKGCGVVESGLCKSCKNNIIDEKFGKCLFCNSPIVDDNLCSTCRPDSPFARIYVVGTSTGTLKRLVYDFKFNSEYGNAKVLAELLHEILPIMPENTVVIPIPTVPKHIRQRGFGHTEKVASLLAKKRKMKFSKKLLKRADNSVQHGLKARERAKAAAKTFYVPNLPKNLPREILLVDDICTTGSTVKAAAKLLKSAGVKTINLAIIARHEK